MESLKASTEDQMMGCIARPGEQSYYLKNDILGIGSSRLLGASRGVSVDVHAAVGLFLLRRRPNYLYPCFTMDTPSPPLCHNYSVLSTSNYPAQPSYLRVPNSMVNKERERERDWVKDLQ